MKHLRFILSCLALAGALTASAQDFSSFATSMPKMKVALAKVLADTPEFSADTVVGALDSQRNLQQALPMKIALTPDRMRQEIDLTQMTNLPAAARDMMQQAHLNKMVIITQTDTKKVYVVFPGVQAYQEFSTPNAVVEEMTARAAGLTSQRKVFGEETVQGHHCTEISMMFTETNKPAEFAVLAYADDLPRFPIRMDILTSASKTRFFFDHVDLSKPATALFEVPAGYTAFSSSAGIMQYAREKLQNRPENPPQ